MNELLAAGEMPWTPAEYHRDRQYVNHSSMKVFRHSRPLYHAIYIAGTMEREPPTREMRLGSGVDIRWMRPGYWDAEVAVGNHNRASNVGKAFVAANPGKLLLNEDELELVRGMTAALNEDEEATSLLARAATQRAICWECRETGLPRKMLADLIIPDARIIADLKTTDDPSPEGFAPIFRRFGYHRAAAWYIDGAIAQYGADEWVFYHIVVGSEPPHRVVVYPLSDAYLRLAREQNSRDLEDLRECLDSGVWKHSWQIGIAPAIEPAKWEM